MSVGLVTTTHPTETKVVLCIPKELLVAIGHLMLDLGMNRTEVAILLLTEALAERRAKAQREG